MNTILITLLIIAVLILAHEWGHFVVARRIGIPVYEFGIGFGPKLFSWKRNGVVYSLRAIPLGGFVRMAGEEPGDPEEPDGFSHRTPLEKIRVSFAGPFMNFILALLIFVFSYSVMGLPHSSNEAVIGTVIKGKPADLAGIRANDRIVSVNGIAINSWADFNQQTSQSNGQPLELQLERNQQLVSLQVVPVKLDSSGNMGIGVLNRVIYEKQGIIKSMELGLKQTYELTLLLFSALGILITGGASMGDLAGPVGITRLVDEFAQVGIVFLLNFTAFLSINLGIMNLLPIPALDGSKIVFAVVEAIRKKPLDPEKEGFLNWIGFLFLIGLMIIVTFNDIVRWIRG
ncbi:MAG: RIP metalloprotease RseP [Syntrophomonas sp.]|uniref:RIP metalloprotease RseP n=1 Tax=Syntrophomonas sp. TaxID=2053627 RepID=UPI0026222452|nr:RIP metalloprotease RseP [Syntrophomonas sp.]MDD2510027.1 RIP metalloprotease RseP [Syntrophomonas sp.]MDD3878635.1 RIP metalloprotease RseP [Syntrophomonas sp.]MDD4626096.1 RIP metalloprotease RseP [Syntrophomonas sp.]